MSPTQTLDVAVGEYVGQCMEHLRDLPEETQGEIIEDIRQMVAEVSAELGGRPADLLGPPDRFVDELRLAAGVGRTVEPPADGGQKRPKPFADQLMQVWDRFNPSDVATWLRTLYRELRPAGWVLRGYAFGAFAAYSLSDGTAEASWLLGVVPIPQMVGSAILGGLVTAASIAASVELGRRKPDGWLRAVVIAAGLASVLVLGATTADLRAQELIRAGGTGSGTIFADVPPVPSIAEEAIIDPPSGVAIIVSDGNSVLEARSMTQAVDNWIELADGSSEYPVDLAYRGQVVTATNPGEIVAILRDLGLPES